MTLSTAFLKTFSGSSPVRLLDDVEAAVEDLLGRAPLAGVHHGVDELGHQRAAVDGVRRDFPLGNLSSAWHIDAPYGRRVTALRAAWRPYFDAALLAALDADGVERAADDVVAHPGQVLDAAAADEHQRVLLQVVPDARDVGRDLDPVGEPHARHLAEGRVRLLGRLGEHAHADPALLRVVLQRRALGLHRDLRAALANQLADSRHDHSVLGETPPRLAARGRPDPRSPNENGLPAFTRFRLLRRRRALARLALRCPGPRSGCRRVAAGAWHPERLPYRNCLTRRRLRRLRNGRNLEWKGHTAHRDGCPCSPASRGPDTR